MMLLSASLSNFNSSLKNTVYIWDVAELCLVIAQCIHSSIIYSDSCDWNVGILQEGPRNKEYDDDYDESNCQVAQCRQESLTKTILLVSLVE